MGFPYFCVDYWIEIRFTGKKTSIFIHYHDFIIHPNNFMFNHPFPHERQPFYSAHCAAQVAPELLQPGPKLRFHRAGGELHHPTRQFQRQFACWHEPWWVKTWHIGSSVADQKWQWGKDGQTRDAKMDSGWEWMIQWWSVMIIDHPQTDPQGCWKMFMALPENAGTTWWMSDGRANGVVDER